MERFFCLFLLAAVALSWGPPTHQEFGHVVNAEAKMVENYFVPGNSAPDAFKSLNSFFHSVDFSLYLILYAKANSVPESLMDFSVGYSCHLAEDMVGHHKNSYLNPKYDTEVEFAVDTYNIKEQSLDVDEIPSDVAGYITRANIYVSSIVGESVLPIYNSSVISLKIDEFKNLVNTEVDLARLNVLYKDELVKFDFCNASDYEETMNNLKMASTMSESTCKYLISLIPGLKTVADVPVVKANVDGFVESLFNDHNGTICNT